MTAIYCKSNVSNNNTNIWEAHELKHLKPNTKSSDINNLNTQLGKKKRKVKHIQSKIKKIKEKINKTTTVSATHQEEINYNPSKLHQGNQRRWGEKEKKNAQLRGTFQFNKNFLKMKNLNSSITSLFDSSSCLISKITSMSICIIL